MLGSLESEERRLIYMRYFQDMTQTEIMELIEEEDVEFIRLQFTDILGLLKNVAVTPAQMEKVLLNMQL